MSYEWKPILWPEMRESEVHPHVDAEQAHLFTTFGGGSTEYEVLNWLNASIRVFKPNLILETGAFEGVGTVALASACRENGFGKVISLESDPKCVEKSKFVLEKENLSSWAEVCFTDSLSFIEKNNLVFDMGFFDSETSVRAFECLMLLEKKQLRKIAVFHDTSAVRLNEWYAPGPDRDAADQEQKEYREKIFELSKRPECTGYFESPLSRGFMGLFFKS